MRLPHDQITSCLATQISLENQIEKGLLAHTHYVQSRKVHSIKCDFSISGVPYARRYCLLQKQIAKRTFLVRKVGVLGPAHFPSDPSIMRLSTVTLFLAGNF